ncbi:MAG: GntR family transcriptional regulator [Pseudolabrys sp.]|jgi:DNA-binding GntR family transcriptional regulator
MHPDKPYLRGPRPLRPNSLRERIRENIRHQIQHGEIGPAACLVDVEMADRLGVSRVPVREALLQLVNEGYLVGTTRGFVLPKLSAQDIGDIFEVRKLLEPRAAANAARLSPTRTRPPCVPRWSEPAAPMRRMTSTSWRLPTCSFARPG